MKYITRFLQIFPKRFKRNSEIFIRIYGVETYKNKFCHCVYLRELYFIADLVHTFPLITDAIFRNIYFFITQIGNYQFKDNINFSYYTSVSIGKINQI